MIRLSQAAAPLALAAAFIVAAAVSWPVVDEEHRSSIAEAQLGEFLGGSPPLFWEDADEDEACGKVCPPRVAAANGLAAATEAMRAPRMIERVTKAAQAEALLRRALDSRPNAGEWWGWLAYAETAAGEDPADVGRALDRSYRYAPYLPHLAAWRVAISGRTWANLPPAAQVAAANEAAWLKSVEPQEGLAEAIVGATPDPVARAALAAALGRPAPPSVPHRISGIPSDIALRR